MGSPILSCPTDHGSTSGQAAITAVIHARQAPEDILVDIHVDIPLLEEVDIHPLPLG